MARQNQDDDGIDDDNDDDDHQDKKRTQPAKQNGNDAVASATNNDTAGSPPTNGTVARDKIKTQQPSNKAETERQPCHDDDEYDEDNVDVLALYNMIVASLPLSSRQQQQQYLAALTRFHEGLCGAQRAFDDGYYYYCYWDDDDDDDDELLLDHLNDVLPCTRLLLAQEFPQHYSSNHNNKGVFDWEKASHLILKVLCQDKMHRLLRRLVQLKKKERAVRGRAGVVASTTSVDMSSSSSSSSRDADADEDEEATKDSQQLHSRRTVYRVQKGRGQVTVTALAPQQQRRRLRQQKQQLVVEDTKKRRQRHGWKKLFGRQRS
eukprot:CAMPEP_0168739034 /NCGR_PEP_ID=MMETSP0724-20121128/11244_1 /TAXON_ID=265536 /ORGANISM="Amphiprora sp., Strain CCMP467" /LENGTH=319 /DNA_ID=CAMNT_0008786403 /DNA_START=286 /DNA_END=1244 /DNA_ORIENTATION=+